MTDIDKMEAGAELNALVAERVMGWSDGPHTFYRWQDRKKRERPLLLFHCAPGGGIGNFDAHVDESGQKFYCGEPKRLFKASPYSTDWAAAGEVLEAIPPDDFDDFTRILMNELGVTSGYSAHYAYQPVSDTLRGLTPEAISRAACKAVEKGAA